VILNFLIRPRFAVFLLGSASVKKLRWDDQNRQLPARNYYKGLSAMAAMSNPIQATLAGHCTARSFARKKKSRI